ncbi:universal stress protein, partial [Rhizobium leguminosarum]
AVADFAFAIAAESGAHVIGLHGYGIGDFHRRHQRHGGDDFGMQALKDMAHSETIAVERIFRAKAEAAGASLEWRSFAT